MPRTLHAVSLFGASLPYGPAVQPPAGPQVLQPDVNKTRDDERTLDGLSGDYILLDQLEAKLSLVAGHDPEEVEKHAGRSKGPIFKRIDAATCEVAGGS